MSIRPWVISAGPFRPDFRVGRLGIYWWVISAQNTPDPPPPPPPPPHIFYNINKTAHNDKLSFMMSHTSLCSAAVSKEPYTVE